MKYTLTLPKGQISFKHNLFIGSTTAGQWAPMNPAVNGGWKNGDILQVSCTYNLNPNIHPLPSASAYEGLVVGALNNATKAQIDALMRRIISTWSGGTVVAGITTNGSPGPGDIFYAAKAEKFSAPLSPPSRGTLTNLVYEWTMTYNGGGGYNPNNVELVFGYGDPQESETDT